jgi:hypothetical protein
MQLIGKLHVPNAGTSGNGLFVLTGLASDTLPETRHIRQNDAWLCLTDTATVYAQFSTGKWAIMEINFVVLNTSINGNVGLILM